MKVTERTDEILILDYKPWLISLGLILGMVIFLGLGLHLIFRERELFAGVMFAGIGTLVFTVCFLAFSRRVQLIFDRSAGQIVRRQRSFWGYRQDVYPFAAAREVVLEETKNDDGRLFRPVLKLEDHDDLPILQVYSSGKLAQSTADVVNTWLADKAE